MRWLPKVIPVLIVIIALDFALVFGFEAFRVLSSPIYGLEQSAFSNLIYGVAGLFGIGAQGLFGLAAFFGGIYLTIAVVLMLHLASRVGAVRGGKVSHDLLDAGLILVVLATIVAATPAIMKGASDILIQERLPLWLVGLAATLSMIERLPESDTSRPGWIEQLFERYAARRKRAGSTIVTPALRKDSVADRWDDLRHAGGMVIEPVPVARPVGPWFPLRPR